MSKYDPLHHHLARQSTDEHPMSFAEVEAVLGFPLPPSARTHPAWWSNNEGTNVAVRAWRRAGRKTARVDVPGGRVVFVRDADASLPRPAGPSDPDSLVIDTRALPLNVQAALRRQGGGAQAAVELMAFGAVELKRRLLEELRELGPTPGPSSVELIREDRDGR